MVCNKWKDCGSISIELAFGTTVIWIKWAERLVELWIRVLPVFLKTIIFIILFYKTTRAVTRLSILGTPVTWFKWAERLIYLKLLFYYLDLQRVFNKGFQNQHVFYKIDSLVSLTHIYVVTTQTQGHMTGTKGMGRHKVTNSQSKP